jgi:hypothetical protein
MGKQTIFVKKAQPTGDQSIPDVVISVTQTLPQSAKDAMSLEQFGQLFDDQAKGIEGALYESLPGGTYDRLLGRMLLRKASHFIVSHRGPTGEATNA